MQSPMNSSTELYFPPSFPLSLPSTCPANANDSSTIRFPVPNINIQPIPIAVEVIKASEAPVSPQIINKSTRKKLVMERIEYYQKKKPTPCLYCPKLIELGAMIWINNFMAKIHFDCCAPCEGSKWEIEKLSPNLEASIQRLPPLDQLKARSIFCGQESAIDKLKELIKNQESIQLNEPVSEVALRDQDAEHRRNVAKLKSEIDDKNVLDGKLSTSSNNSDIDNSSRIVTNIRASNNKVGGALPSTSSSSNKFVDTYLGSRGTAGEEDVQTDDDSAVIDSVSSSVSVPLAILPSGRAVSSAFGSVFSPDEISSKRIVAGRKRKGLERGPSESLEQSRGLVEEPIKPAEETGSEAETETEPESDDINRAVVTTSVVNEISKGL